MTTKTRTRTQAKQRESYGVDQVFQRTCEIRKEDIDANARSISVSFSSETDKISFFGYRQILLHEKASADFSQLRDMGSVLHNHDPDRVIGRPEDVTLDEKERKGRAKIVFDDDPESDRVLRKVLSGSIKGVSVGFRVDQWQMLNEGEVWTSPEKRTFKGPADIATKWRAIEFSITPIPADGSVGVGRTDGRQEPQPERKFSMDPKLKAALIKRGLKADATDEEAQEFALRLATEDQPKPEDKKVIDLPKTQARTEEEIRSDERKRQKEIRDICSPYECTRALANSLVESGASVEATRKACLDAMRANQTEINPVNRVALGEEEKDKWDRAAEDSILLRVNKIKGEKAAERMAAARDTECFTLFDLARESLRRGRVVTRGMTKDQIIFRALSHSTSDFPKILENVMGKALLQAWEEAPATWRPLVKVVNAADFKAMSRPKLGDAGDLELTPELTPMPEGSFAEAKESYAIATYSKRFGISRQAIVNDDLSAFDDIPTKMGSAARRLVSKLFYDLLISASGVGPTMSEDSAALFATTHTSGANYVNGTGAPDVAGLAVAMKNMRLQKGLAASGETAPILNLMPSFLLVPAALEVTAKQTINSIADPAKSNSITANPFASMLQVITEGRLDAATNGGTAWYLVASPSTVSGAEIAFLNGQEQPNVIRQEGTNVLGVEMGVYSDVGVKFVEHRGWHRTKGA